MPFDHINPFGEQRKFYSRQAEIIFNQSHQLIAALTMEEPDLWHLFFAREEKTFPSRLAAIAYMEGYLADT